MEATRTSSDGGFTLIELMIVIVVLGLVAATVLFAASGVSDRGTASVCKANLKQIEGAEEAYFSQFASYTTIPDLVSRRLLREAPASSDYSFAVDLATGEVTSTPPVRHSDSVTASCHSECAGEAPAQGRHATLHAAGPRWTAVPPPSSTRGRRPAPRRGTASG